MGGIGAHRGSGGIPAGQTVSAPQNPQNDLGQPQIVPLATQAQSANNDTFKDTDTQDYHDLYNGRQYYQSQTFPIDTQYALQDYLADQPMAGSMYSVSQDLNYAMAQGKNLTANQQYMVDSLMDGMHNIGYNINLTHYARVNMIDAIGKATGINITSGNYENMSASQLAQLKGKSFSIDQFVSASYNNFKNAPNGGRPFTDKAVILKIKAPARAQALMPGNGPGGALGEMVLAPGQNYRITNVSFPGGMGRSGASSYKKVVFEVEIY